MTNGRYGGGSAGKEHRYHFPALDAARFEEAGVGAVDGDSRWGGEKGVILPWPNTMGVDRGAIMGNQGPGCDAPRGFKR